MIECLLVKTSVKIEFKSMLFFNLIRSIRKTDSAEAIWKIAGYVIWLGKRLALHSESKPIY